MTKFNSCTICNGFAPIRPLPSPHQVPPPSVCLTPHQHPVKKGYSFKKNPIDGNRYHQLAVSLGKAGKITCQVPLSGNVGVMMPAQYRYLATLGSSMHGVYLTNRALLGSSGKVIESESPKGSIAMRYDAPSPCLMPC